MSSPLISFATGAVAFQSGRKSPGENSFCPLLLFAFAMTEHRSAIR
jgi:hypothetical protein